MVLAELELEVMLPKPRMLVPSFSSVIIIHEVVSPLEDSARSCTSNSPVPLSISIVEIKTSPAGSFCAVWTT